MKPIVYISRLLNKDGLEELEKNFRIIMRRKRTPPSRKEFLANVKKADALVTSLVEKVDEEVFRAGSNLKVVANYAVGFDNIDLKAAAKYGVPVSNTPGDYAEAVAEQALALLLAVSKRIVEGDRFMRQGKYKAWDPLLFLGDDLRGRTLGIIGTGRIGSFLARMGRLGFNMPIIYHDVVRNQQIEKDYQARFVPMAELLKTADFVSLHVPLLPTTRHLIGAKELSAMKQTAILINTSRGPVVDEKALVNALKKKIIAGAGLDVYEFEPKLAPGLSKLDNVVLTPHTASATHAARREMALIASSNIMDVLLQGKRPRNEVKAV
jgi:lactate dehydrogenase-like 2-hydroxyacid dehydrogenase